MAAVGGAALGRAAAVGGAQPERAKPRRWKSGGGSGAARPRGGTARRVACAAKKRRGGFGTAPEDASPLSAGGWRHAGGSLTATQEFARWAQDEGLPRQAVTLRTVPGQGRGLVAAREINKGELLLGVPRRLLLTPRRALEELPEEHAEALAELPEYSVLAGYLAAAATPGYIPETSFSKYIAALPPASGCVIEWPERETRELLRGSPTLTAALERRAQADFMRAELRDAFNAAGLRPPPDGALTWALSMLLSRAVRLENMAVETAAGDATKGGAGEGKGELALVPWADFANHSPTANASGAHIDWRSGVTSGAVTLPAARDYREGDQVFGSYGDRTSAELLLSYGFVPADTPPCEAVDVALALPADDEWREAKAEALQARGISPGLAVFPCRLTGAPPEMLAFALVAVAEPRDAAEAEACVAAAFGEDGAGVVGKDWSSAAKSVLADVASDMQAGYPGTLKQDERAAEEAGPALVDTMDERERELAAARYCACAAVRARERRVLARLEFVMSSGATEDYADAKAAGQADTRNVPLTGADGILGSIKLPKLPDGMPKLPDMPELPKLPFK